MSRAPAAAPAAIGDAPLRIHARWDGAGVSALRIDNRRPRAAQLLVGRSVAEARALVPRLFAVCGRAQAIAAHFACAAAAENAPAAEDVVRFERAIAAEAAAEHLWRLLLDWPALLGLEPRRQRFAELHRRLAQAQDLEAVGDELAELIGRELLPGLGRDWNAGRSIAELAERSAAGGAVGDVLARLLADPPCPPSSPAAPALLAEAPAAAWLQAWRTAEADGAGGHSFCAAPTWHGRPAETGAFARYTAARQVRLLWEAGYGVAARLWARLVALADCAVRLVRPLAHGVSALADAASSAPGLGLARVECARGVLLHRVRLEGERIADYAICAPTEWNFHPDGPFVREAAVRAADHAAATRQLAMLALALDPCVGYVVNLIDETAGPDAGGGDA